MMLDGGAPYRCLAALRPGSLMRRDQRETGFIFQTEDSAQLPTLFLSWATLLLSTVQLPHHRAGTLGAAGAGCSIPSAASHAKPSLDGSAPQRAARLPGQFDPASNNLPHTQKHRLLFPIPFPAVSPAFPTISLACPADDRPFSSSDAWLAAASGPRSAV